MILLFILAALALPVQAQNPDSLWMEPYLRRNQGQVQTIRQTADGGYIMIGTIQERIDSNVCVVRTDSVGHKLWDRRYGNGGCSAGDIRPTRDGGFILAATQHPYTEQTHASVLTRLDNAGSALWSQSFQMAGGSGAQAVFECSDGGFAYCGWAAGRNGEWDVCLAKTDSFGNLIWNQTYGGNGEDCGTSLRQTADGGFVVCGWTTSFGQGDLNSYLLRTDSTGKALWWRTLGEDCRYHNVEIVAGGFVIAGEGHSDLWNTQRITLTRTDSAGGLLWNRVFPTRDEKLDRMMLRVLEDGFKVAFFQIALDGSQRNMCIVKTDREGEPLWNGMYSNAGVDLTDRRRRFWYRWSAGSFARGIKDFFGHSAPSVAIMSIQPSAPFPYKDPVRWYQRLWKPYHFSAWTTINYSLPRAGRVSLSTFNAQGREVLPILKGYCDEGELSAFLVGTALPVGIYFLRLECDDAVILKKILILK
ncbi:T9SS C-terminal target domain-containing protein [candidate division KSB1 bacterium]|nr:MAG: T9SS C-terminal target domain-containing protein [candidate division KSB1 bacterium]